MGAIRLVLILVRGTMLAVAARPRRDFPLGIYAPGSTNNLQAIRSAGFKPRHRPRQPGFSLRPPASISFTSWPRSHHSRPGL